MSTGNGGEFGSALFQSIYCPGPSPLFLAPVMFEWYVIGMALLLVGGVISVAPLRAAGGVEGALWQSVPGSFLASGALALTATVGLCGLTAWA